MRNATGLPGMNTNMLPLALAERLAQHGVRTLPGAKAYAALIRADLASRAMSAPRPPRPLLDCTADELIDLARAAAIVGTDATRNVIGLAMTDILASLAGEFLDSLRASADDIIRELRPAFDAAADQGRKVAGYGIDPNATPEQMLDRPAEQVAAWKRFRDVDVHTLEAIADTRRLMSEILGIAPTVSPLPATPGREHSDRNPGHVNHAVAILKPWGGQTLEAHDGDTGGHVKWLRLAPYLHLCTLDEIDPLDAIRAAGVSTVILEGVAQARHDAANTTT